jgi:hypothetical protein
MLISRVDIQEITFSVMVSRVGIKPVLLLSGMVGQIQNTAGSCSIGSERYDRHFMEVPTPINRGG